MLPPMICLWLRVHLTAEGLYSLAPVLLQSVDLPPQLKLHCEQLMTERNRADGALNFSPCLIQTSGADRLNSDWVLLNDMRACSSKSICPAHTHWTTKAHRARLIPGQLKSGKLESLVTEQYSEFLYMGWLKRGLNTHKYDSRWTCRALLVPPHAQSVSWHHKGPALPWDNASPELTTQKMHRIIWKNE